MVKQFFFEKKNQKTFLPAVAGLIDKSFLLLFFKKEVLAFLLLCVPAYALDLTPDSSPSIESITPGAHILMHAGHYTSPIVIPLSGTAAAPIIIEGQGVQDLDGPIVLDGAAFVVLRHLHIASARDAGIILRHGTHDVTVDFNTIDHPRLGIWIGDGAGDRNLIADNIITGAATHGIAVDRVNAAPDRSTGIARNHIQDSGIHGIELSGNNYVVERNIVSGSGRLSSGASGIHVFAQHAGQGFGLHNAIRDNISFGNHDTSAQDGNGIQIDQWCDDNTVTGNLVTGNDGAGISVFDAARAYIAHNTLFGNMRDPASSHRHRGELVFATDDTHTEDNTRDAKAEANIIAATGPGVAAILVDIPTARHPPHFDNNLLSGTPIARWSGRQITDLAAWNALAPHTRPDLAGTPHFINPASPTRAGFTLQAATPTPWRALGAQGLPTPPP